MRRPEEIDILEMIPQRPPFVMVDRLLSYDETWSLCEFKVDQSNVFCEEDGLSEYGLIENIAQSCAARIGYKNLAQDEGVKIGFIGAIKEIEIFARPRTGDVITTEIRVMSEVFAMTLVEAKVRLGEELLARCEMKISLSDIKI